jgi:Delta3-Delta2-enoyl-CoA isomerase
MIMYLLNQTCLGPAIGFGVTTLALCDVVYSVPHATFKTPFMQLGFCAEGCSSLLFPRIMGPSRANEMLVSYLKFYIFRNI